MMADERHTETVETVTADSAQLAANAAEAAQLAAAETMQHANVAVAGVAQQAANEIADTEERLAQWQAGIATQQEQLASRVTQHEQQIEQKLKSTTDHLMSILSRLDKPPESPTSPPQDQSGTAEGGPKASDAAPTEPKRSASSRAFMPSSAVLPASLIGS
jgi:hypothetical protein